MLSHESRGNGMELKHTTIALPGDSFIRGIRATLFLVNYLIILCIPLLILTTTRQVVADYRASELLQTLSSVPTPPVDLLLRTQIAFLIFLGLTVLRGRSRTLPRAIQTILTFVDILLSVYIIYCLSIGDKGILLLAITNIILYVAEKRTKYVLIVFCFLLYIFLDYDLLSVRLDLYSFNNYIAYYNIATRTYLFGVRNILFSLNQVLFILFLIFEIQRYFEESSQVKKLNRALFDSAERLTATNIQLKEYSTRNEEMAKLKERNRLAREIHDTIGHYLTAMDFGVKTCLQAMHNNKEVLESYLDKINQLTQKALLDVRRSIKELRPDALTRYSLHAAIEHLCNELTEFTRARVTFRCSEVNNQLSGQVEEFIYRIVQEGITNAMKHANSTHILIQIDYLETDIQLLIRNDGVSNQVIHPGFGLTHISKKVEDMAGNFSFGIDDQNWFWLKIDFPNVRGVV